MISDAGPLPCKLQTLVLASNSTFRVSQTGSLEEAAKLPEPDVLAAEIVGDMESALE